MPFLRKLIQNASDDFSRYRILIVFIFFIYFLIGVNIFRDYGISWDEHIQRLTGQVSLKYVTDKHPLLLNYPDRYYGSIFEMLLVVGEKVLKIERDTRAVYLMRHFLTFLLCYIGTVFFYKLNKIIFHSRKWALLSTIMLILSPRLFAHSFFNSKDMIFLSLFTISVFSLLKFIEKRNFKITVIHALTTALAVDVRIPGVLLLALTWMGVGLSLCWPKSGKKEIKRNIVMLVIYTICALGFIVLFWPILWSNPIHHFVEAFQEMSKYPSDGKVLYFGKYVFSTQLPWHYVPGWIFITTPLLYSFLFIIGCCHLAVRVQQNKEIVFNAVILGWFFIPLMAVIIFKSVMYDACRQMFFIYPSLIIIAASGTRFLYDWIMKLQNRVKKRVSAIIFKSLLIGYLLSILVTMMQYHPFQNVYFNSVLGPDLSFVKYKFDLDYWGLSYRNALEYILRTDPSTQIPITAANSPGRTNALILPEEDRNRLVYVSHPEQAKYFLSNDRGRIEDYSFPNLYYGIDLDGARIMGVYKLK